ncbi:transcriptional regulator [Domibacillus sp. PGB-M46]|uniref:LexA family protein n=1 Tax=Domibacillus sp. PGB-M46 TaxID=2910255 RepID=UPI001F580F7F|nr:transcriptional regulator [Domibacillus sp. PGB-M46]MCI2254145.1 transcriptional regulator [Domibacillus sp. PGB-M46]
MLNQLSVRQQKMLLYINECVRTKNYPPAIREIGETVELKSASTVKGHLDRLKESGYVTWEDRKPRTLRVTGKFVQ